MNQDQYKATMAEYDTILTRMKGLEVELAGLHARHSKLAMIVQLYQTDIEYGISASGLNLEAFGKALEVFQYERGGDSAAPLALKCILLAYVNG